ncbi:Hypothetical predicted protein [Paramuricea clavata]|uniref:Uncharacterized protein n=1 Tax=Paramuricea clavata TaxID=317549 RepID=A0A6S7G5G4_PARCT|nr:Hypothetical predicted protein [Paramuricea clavata]
MERSNGRSTSDVVELLRDKNSQLKENIQQKENENAQLKNDLQTSNGIISQLVEIIHNLELKNAELVLEKKWLFSRIEQLKCKECNKNCVLRTMLWICQTEKLGLGVDLCIRQLEKIIIAHAGAKIEKDDLKCEQLMEILRKCEIVAIAVEYKYPPEMNAKLRVIDEAWDRLMTTDGSARVMILGRVISVANDEGHAEVCDLDTRGDGRVTIHNPQKEEWGHGNQQNFRDYVIKDEGLILYTVNLEKLKLIIKEHEDILHRTNRSDQTLAIASGAIDGVQ